MGKYQSCDPIDHFVNVLGAKYVLQQADEKAPYLREWRDKYTGQAAAILRPGSVAEIVKIVKIANDHKVALVPQGGNTGLVGGQIAFDEKKQFVVNLSRLNTIRAVDPHGYTMTVEAGVILKNAQDAADEVERLFPLSLGSEGSCQIGGNLSSNAGGTGVLAYGNARELALGLEVVLPNGTILNDLNTLRKNNTGYDLKDLFIGAEGTLGFITAAVLKLFPKPKGRQAAFIAFETLTQAGQFFNTAKDLGGSLLTAFEIMPRIAIEFLVKHLQGARDPLKSPYPWYALIEVSSGQSEEHANALLMEMLETGFSRNIIADGALAASESQRQNFWHMRHELSSCQKPEGGSIKHDVSVPVSALPDFLKEAIEKAQALIPGCRPVPFGHWGDGNIHLNISQPVDMKREVFLARWQEMNAHMHQITLQYGGSISAEHGIGILKRDELKRVKDPVALALMHQIKSTLDPNKIMNPGKVI